MVSRIARVAWWLGLRIALILVGVLASQAYERNGCPDTLLLATKVQSDSAASYAKYQHDHPRQHNGIADEFLAQADAANNMLSDPRDTQELRDNVQTCSRSSDYTIAIVLILTLVLWTLANVLGSSFWRPPVLRP